MVAIRAVLHSLPIDQVIHGDALAELRKMADNSVSAIITDPPYGLGEVKDIGKLLIAWASGEDGSEFNNKKGFMAKGWDAVPSPLIWKEAYRVLRPGGHLLAFAGTRTWDLMSMAIRLAGFEDRDTIAHLAGQPADGVSALLACQGQGFPKSTDISKQIDKMQGAEREVVGRSSRHAGGVNNKYAQDEWTRNNAATMGMYITAPATPEAQQWAGYGSSLKPAFEPILVFRKPLDGTLAANVLKWQGCGALNIDASRITHNEPLKTTQRTAPRYSGVTMNNGVRGGVQSTIASADPQGRFPSNLLLSHSLFCQHIGTKRVRGTAPHGRPSREQTKQEHYTSSYGFSVNSPYMTYTDPDGMEEVEDWQCSDDCPVRILGEQSGERQSGAHKPHVYHNTSAIYGNGKGTQFKSGMITSPPSEASTGTAARYFTNFPPDAPDFVPFRYVSKASRSDRSSNGTVNNTHPTTKSTSLMSWLVQLCSPPGGIVLDPFFGSGSTGVACVQTGHHFIGIEQSIEYCQIAEARIRHAMQEVSE